MVAVITAPAMGVGPIHTRIEIRLELYMRFDSISFAQFGTHVNGP